MTPHAVEYPYIRFAGSSSYSRHGDTVSLFVERIDNLNDAGAPSDNLCLQLWACQSPYTGGNLTGWKLAEFPLGVLQPGHFFTSVQSDEPASFPEFGDFAITLVVAEWDGEGFNLIHDFHNYPYRDVFIHPRFEGTVGYRFVDDKHLVVEVESIRNPRDADNMSGSLSLELWALPEPYVAGDFQGYALCSMTLPSLSGGTCWRSGAYEMEIVSPPADTYTLVLMLREWNGDSYVTRDHCNFGLRVTFPLVIPATQASPSAITDESVAQVQTAKQEAPASHTEHVERPAQDSGPPTPQETKATSPAQNVKTGRMAQRLDAVETSF